MKKTSLILLLCLFSSHIWAQQDTSKVNNLFDLSLEELMEMDVVSSSKSYEKKELAPNVISIFPRNVNEKFNWNSINEILTKHQGFFPSQDYDRRTIGFRGMNEGWNNNHLLMLVDGVPFNDNLYGTAYSWEITPLFFSKNLEIIRGPGAALYGSNAVYGAITMNTASPDDFEGKNVILRTQYGERNTHYHDVMALFSSSKVDITTSLSYRKTDGLDYLSYDDSGRVDENGDAMKFQVPDERSSYYWFLKLEGKEQLKGLSLQYHRQFWDYKTGHGWLWHIPDRDETMKESRDIVSLKYTYSGSENFVPEFVARYQRHGIDWDMRYYHAGSFTNFYPNGVDEYLKTSGHDIFTRLQLKYNLPNEGFVLAGVEPTIFLYNGDEEHYANADLTDSQGLGFAPFTQNQPMGDWFEYINGKPVTNIGSFLHFSSGKILGEMFRMSLGLRYDNQFFKYTDINATGRPEENKNFDQFSPRLAFIFAPNENLTIKTTAGKAFRAPTPTEMFGSNTFTLASNINQIKAEEIETYDIELNYKFAEHFHLNFVSYLSKLDGQIAYSEGNNNLSTNIYDLTNIGAETGINYSREDTYGFLNFAYTQRVNESIFEAEKAYVTEHDDKLTWAPALTINAGIAKQFGPIDIALSGHYQSQVERRDLDAMTTKELEDIGLSENPRGEEVDAWFSMDLKVSYKINDFEIGLDGKNLLDEDIFLVRSLKYPFDYKLEGRRVGLFIKAAF